MVRWIAVQRLLVALTLASFAAGLSTSAGDARRAMTVADDASTHDVYLNERNELDGQLFDERGDVMANSRINLKRRPVADEILKRQQPGFDYGSQKVRGVSIGGWLVLEPWITPSIFDATNNAKVVDEWTLGKYVGNAGSILEQHWASFITANDFAQIAAAGLNHVRIPIGYWALDKGTTPYYQGSQYSYLKKAIGWAQNNGLKVIVDLHGVPGSQNGFDNSGRRISPPRWFNQESYKTRSLALVQRFAQDFASNTDTVVAIEVVNEPATFIGGNSLPFTRDYYSKAYPVVRNPNGNDVSNFAVMYHDAFQPLSYWNGAFPSPQYQQVILDTHPYSVFSPEQIAWTMAQRMQYFCNMTSSLSAINSNVWTIAGEWTAAITDCAKYLNGRGIGARYDGTYPGSTRKGSCASKTGSGSNFSAKYKSLLKQSFDTQRKVFESSSTGWVHWTWKTESSADWDYQKGLAGGWITRNLDDFGSASC